MTRLGAISVINHYIVNWKGDTFGNRKIKELKEYERTVIYL